MGFIAPTFCENSESPNEYVWAPSVPNFIPIGRKTWKLRIQFPLPLRMKYDFNPKLPTKLP